MIEQINYPKAQSHISSEKAKIFNCVEWSKIQKVYNYQSAKEYLTIINDTNNLNKTNIIKFHKINKQCVKI